MLFEYMTRGRFTKGWLILLKGVKSNTVLLIGYAFIIGEVGSMIGGKFLYVVTWKDPLFLFFSESYSIAEDASVIDGAFILLRLFRFASVV